VKFECARWVENKSAQGSHIAPNDFTRLNQGDRETTGKICRESVCVFVLPMNT